MITLTEENYIKAIYHLGKQGRENVNTNALAEAMNTKASSATDMIRKLAEKDYANYKKYKGVTLTESGKDIAINIIRKHRLWEVFLVEKLNFTWDEVHELAEQLEHIKSQKLIDELDAFLGHPTHDPHGDPIPDKNGEFTFVEKIVLSQAQEHQTYSCLGVNDSSTEFLQYLNKNDIGLGSTIEVVHIEPFDKSINIKANGKLLTVSQSVAKNLYLKKL
ncbi:iron (metal) dependent repressor, DtxR family [Bizionia echini]|uniref:Transcriptional regulator MntR n=1 Tax=Bizionia echini TaxID=649333 RepID=A0A1I4Z542_9FLAO|nr:metal-dependent transcriptional regulator [Bizionia echini]MBP92551.1 metal-dependent transcriptional regulator [Flavobacteriaceae bacterium]SFN45382.1 iron (metal) dependent repressor, DtxR family [Bizionia echini]|tara:strand:- start:621 stop:1277 length:657 start_codon:yes stop_codon:yes gene_type:complete